MEAANNTVNLNQYQEHSPSAIAEIQDFFPFSLTFLPRAQLKPTILLPPLPDYLGQGGKDRREGGTGRREGRGRTERTPEPRSSTTAEPTLSMQHAHARMRAWRATARRHEGTYTGHACRPARRRPLNWGRES